MRRSRPTRATKRAWRCASIAGSSQARRTTSASSRPIRCSASSSRRPPGIAVRPGRHRRPVAAGRRHRDHEHHADGGQRADARDRPAQGARREAARHHVAGADRIDHAVDGRRHPRHRARSAVLDDHFVADAGAIVGRAVVGGARRDHYCGGGLVLRLDAGAARGDAGPHRSACGGNSGRCRDVHQTGRAAGRDRRDGVRHLAQQQDALGADRAGRRHRRHVDRRHDVADPRVRQLASQFDQLARAEYDLRPEVRRFPVSRPARRSWS